MSAFGDLFDAAANPLLYSGEVGFVETSVAYVHKADPVAGLTAASETYSMIRQSTTDVGGGSRQQHQPVIWRLRISDAARAPQRGDTITHDGTKWSVFDVTKKNGEYRLNARHWQTRA